LLEIVKAIPDFLESRLRLLRLSLKQIHDGQIEIRYIPIVTVPFLQFIQMLAATLKLTFIEKRTRQRQPLGMGRTSRQCSSDADHYDGDAKKANKKGFDPVFHRVNGL
jgi:hypothetical protein